MLHTNVLIQDNYKGAITNELRIVTSFKLSEQTQKIGDKSLYNCTRHYKAG